MKKICIIIPAHWECIMGGAQYQVKQLVEYLIDNTELDITIISRQLNNKFQTDRYKLLNVSAHSSIMKYGTYLDSYNLYRALEKERPDIIYQRVGCAHTGVAAYYAKRKKINMVWHISSDADVTRRREFSSIKHIPKMIERKVLEYGIKHCSNIVAQSEFQKDSLLKNYKRNSIVVKNFHPFPHKKIDGKNKDSQNINVIWVANVKKLKRPDIFIQLANDLAGNVHNTRFIMVGAMNLINKSWRNEINDKIRNSNVEYLGGITQQKVNSLLSNSHILINTSEFEGFSNTFIQAWLRQVPVVSMSCDPDSVIVKNKIGLHSKNYKNLLRDTLKVIQNKHLREDFGRRAQQYAIKNHSKDNLRALVKLFFT